MDNLRVAESGKRAARERAIPAERDPHAWTDGRCRRCGMLDTWPGARYACTGITKWQPPCTSTSHSEEPEGS